MNFLFSTPDKLQSIYIHINPYLSVNSVAVKKEYIEISRKVLRLYNTEKRRKKRGKIYINVYKEIGLSEYKVMFGYKDERGEKRVLYR